MIAFRRHLSFEVRTGIRNRTLLLLYYLFPLGMYLMMSYIMASINPLFQDVIVPAMTLIAILAASLLAIPDPLVNARESGILRSYKINGVPALSLLGMPALTTMLHTTVVTAIIVFTARPLFDAPLPDNFAAFLLVFFAAMFAHTGLGVLIGVMAPSTRATVLLAQSIFLPSMLLGGMMLPYSMLPAGPALVSRILPATHAMNAFSGLAMGGVADFNAWGSVLVLFVGGALAFALARLLFSWDSRNTTRRIPALTGIAALLPYVIAAFLLG